MLKEILAAIKEYGQYIRATMKEYNDFVGGIGKINHREIRRRILEEKCEVWVCGGKTQWDSSRCDLDAVREVNGKMRCEDHAKIEENYLARVASGEEESLEEFHKRVKCFDLSGNQIPWEDLGKDFHK